MTTKNNIDKDIDLAVNLPKSLKDEFIPPPFPFNPPPPVSEYYIVDDKDHTVYNRYDTFEDARAEAKRLIEKKEARMSPLILEFDGQVIKDSEKMNVKYLNKILEYNKGPDMEMVMYLAQFLKPNQK
jgi:hypothetical protein